MPGKLLGLRWITLILLALAAIINFLARNTLSVAAAEKASPMPGELHMGPLEYSYVLLAFQLMIMLQPIVGYIIDRFGLRLGMTFFASLWSLISVAHAGVMSWPMLAALRGGLGFAEGTNNPAGMKAISQWFPAKERGIAGGIYNIGASFGSMIAPPLVAWAILTYNWRIAFVITGALGFFWAALWLLFYRDPKVHPALTDRERDYIAAGQEAHLDGGGARPRAFDLLRLRNMWGIALPRFLADPTWAALSFWLPSYFAKERGFDLKEIGLTAWMPFLAADLGCLFGPLVTHLVQRAGITLINARRATFTLGAFMMIGVAFTGFVADPYAALALLCLAGFAHQTLSVTVITMSTDLFKRNEVATAAGVAGTFGNGGVLLFNTAVGALVALIGYAPFFVALAAFDILGAIVLWTFVRQPRDDRSHA